MEPLQLMDCRRQLIAADLVAFQKALYQVLAVPAPQTTDPLAGPRA